MSRNILSDYLAEIARIRGTGAGTGEISYYGALAGALNAAGAGLKPKVFCVSNLRNRGAGFPDMGLFAGTVRHAADEWPTGRPPERGVVEVDDIPADIGIKQNSAQVRRYLAQYHLVLVTNYRDFVLLGTGPAGAAEVRERFSFNCADADAFFALARGTTRPLGIATRFKEFLERVLLHQAPLARPEDVAFFLASYARDALARVEAQADLPAFADLRAALQEALGLRFDGPKGEHLFRSSLVQTLFYGLFSAWVEVARNGGVFDWRAAGWSLNVPFVDTLFQRIVTPQYLKPLGLEEPLGWAAEALNRVDRDAFFKRFNEADAVRYFYEPFLAAFDPELRKQLGVWYTPREIVRYMVERVDRALRTELGVADGLADENVWILDPCCGTGAFLVEVLDRIARTLKEKGEDALLAEDLKAAATTRVAGFEIMPAPYVIAHWQIGHALRAAGAELGDGERASVYLTNALTGWDAPAEATGPIADTRQIGLRVTFPPLAEERDEAAKVKQTRPILVVLGNPPYNAFAGISPAEEAGLVEPYKLGLWKDWGIRKFNLDDLYVRFFRIAERRITESTGRGIVCYISNHSWVDHPSYVVMRQRLSSEFDRIWIDELHGDRRSSERGPDGATSETIFAIRGFSPGIVQGAAIVLMARRANRPGDLRVRYSASANASRADDRRTQLIANLQEEDFDSQYSDSAPTPENRYSFRPGSVSQSYSSWPTIAELSKLSPFSGALEMRRGALLSMDKTGLEERIKKFLDPDMDFADLKNARIGPVDNMAGFSALKARTRWLQAERFQPSAIRPIVLYPFDVRWAYHTNVQPIWNRSRPELVERTFARNGFVITRFRARRPGEGVPLVWTSELAGYHLLDPNSHPIPVLDNPSRANLSVSARTWLAALGLSDPDADRDIAALPWHHALAIGYTPAWLSENADGIRREWPRVPLPDSAVLLRASAALGARVAALLDPDTAVPGVTAGIILPALAAIGVPAKAGGGQMTEADRTLTAGWGHAGKGGAVMPGRGRTVTRDYTATEAATRETADLLGARTHDISLNADAMWRNIPEAVWDFTIGGYQVLKKWLSYRERPLLGRALTPGEIRYVRDVARRLAALRLMGPELDANYRACADAHMPLPTAQPTS